MQFLQAERRGEQPHDCHECAAAFLWASLIDHIERHGSDRATLAAIQLLEMKPISSAVH